MGSLPISEATRSGVISLNLSHEDDGKRLLNGLNEGGYVVLKNTTSLDSIEQARRNKYVAALLALVRNGNFESWAVHKSYSSLSLVPFGRARNWRELAKERELVAATAYHLGYHLGDADKKVQWNLEYDIGLRGELANKTATIEAGGRDIIFCNSWLARAIPKPDVNVDLIMVMYRSPDINWGNK